MLVAAGPRSGGVVEVPVLMLPLPVHSVFVGLMER
jgi:hypothetical protein